MSKTTTRALFFLHMLCWVWLSSCGVKMKDDCTKHIGEQIRQGVSLEVAESKLRECGFKTAFDPVKDMLYGDRINEGNPVAERVQVIVKLDSDKKVAEVRVSSGLIGP